MPHPVRAFFALGLFAAIARADPVRFLDRFESAAGWSTVPGPGATAVVSHGRPASTLRVDFDFTRGGGEIIVHKRFPLRLPPNYSIAFELRGSAPANGLELRLVDASGQNVRQFHDPEFRFSPKWQTLRVKRRQFEFAWGPVPDRELEELGWFELVVNRVQGGRGTLWIDDLRLEPRPPPPAVYPTPIATASSALPSRAPANLFATDPGQAGWHSAARTGPQWLALDFQGNREYGGLIIDWDAEDYATDYTVEVSADGQLWRRAYGVARGNGDRDYLPMPEAESRHARLVLHQGSRGRGYGIHRLEVAPLDFSANHNHMLDRIARDSGRGIYPRYFSGEQSYWTIAGAAGSATAGAEREVLLNEDGAVEAGEGGYSVEPFLYFAGEPHGWAAAKATQTLEQGYLPIPSTRLDFGPLALTVTALADPVPERPLLVRYRIENTGADSVQASLFLTLRPFQVNPPWQALRDAGGVTRIDRLKIRNGVLWADGKPAVQALDTPAQAGVMGFDQYPVTGPMARDSAPTAVEIEDPSGLASGVLRYPLELASGANRDIHIALPDRDGIAGARSSEKRGEKLWSDTHDRAVRHWQEQLGEVRFTLPAEARELAHAAQTNLAYILLHRDGPALRPGSRRYGRTWIRDGAVASATLEAFGHDVEVRGFLRWYAGYQTPDGALPCCLDPWGPDRMIEHDSVGEFVYTVANYYRHTGDRVFLATLWPRITRAIDYLEGLRRQRLTPEYAQGEKLRYRGLLPESASHEGYVAHPVHSYWDDFWAIRGIADTAWLAQKMGEPALAERYALLRNELRTDVAASIALTQRALGIDHVPGAAELGDYDPTSTAIALSVGDMAHGALEPSLRRTFARYSAELKARLEDQSDWQAYAPYEFRNVSALVRLGEREAAYRTLRGLFEGRRPAGWNQWPEVVWRDPRAPHFLGDLPHSWVGAEFIQAFLALFAYDEVDQRLVLGAGLPAAWLEAPGGVGIEGLRTSYGPLGYRVERNRDSETRMRIEGGITPPPQGILVDLPLPDKVRSIEINGMAQPPGTRQVSVRTLPTEVVYRH